MNNDGDIGINSLQIGIQKVRTSTTCAHHKSNYVRIAQQDTYPLSHFALLCIVYKYFF